MVFQEKKMFLIISLSAFIITMISISYTSNAYYLITPYEIRYKMLQNMKMERYAELPEGKNIFIDKNETRNVDYLDFDGVIPTGVIKNFKVTDYNYSGPNLKKIFILSEDRKNDFGNGQQPFILSRCKINTCFNTEDINQFHPKELDAVLWVNNRASPNQTYNIMPKERYPHTRYVFFEHEPAAHQLVNDNMKLFKDLFNWTITYSRRSDIYRPYSRIVRNKNYDVSHRHYNYSSDINYAKSKTKLVAWFVTNCYASSRREQYVKELQRYIDVDIYGKCGPLKCDRTSAGVCKDFIEKDYKFYLSFENSLCYDYITEKLFHMVLKNVIPVVYGRGPYKKHMPPHSYIDVMDYKTPKDLADYLYYLDQNDEAYNSYFRWKTDYFHYIFTTQNALCDLCEKLHVDKEEKIIPDILEWFLGDDCVIEDNIYAIMNKWWSSS